MANLLACFYVSTIWVKISLLRSNETRRLAVCLSQQWKQSPFRSN